MRFVDTNVPLYAVSALQDECGKAASGTRTADRTRSRGVLSFPVQAITLEVFQAALAIRRRFGLSYWDSAILAAARKLRCDAVYSEDLSTEQDYDGLRVVNPFESARI